MKLYIPTIFLGLILCTFNVFSAVSPKQPESDLQVVHINQATVKELTKRLAGVGVKKATNIVNYRNKHGRFSSIDELDKVDGISQSLISKNKARIKIN